MSWQIDFFSESVKEDTLAFPKSILAKTIAIMEMIEALGPNLGKPYTDSIGERRLKMPKQPLSFHSFKEEVLSDPEVRAEYEALRPLFDLKKQMIKARLEANMNQEDVAQALHTKKSNISRLESPNARHLPNLKTLMAYAKAVGWDLEISFKKSSAA